MRLQQKRPSTDRWVVRQDGRDVYRGGSVGYAFDMVAADPNVQVLLNGRQVWPPSDELPFDPETGDDL